MISYLETLDLMDIALSEEWGTDAQVEAETMVYEFTGAQFGIEWEDVEELNGATLEEMMATVLRHTWHH